MRTLSTIIAACICICACASTQLAQPKLDEPLSEPIATEPQPVDDTAAYEASLDHITQTIRGQCYAIMSCGEAHAQDCHALRIKVCQITEMVDSRGGRHQKPCCPRSSP